MERKYLYCSQCGISTAKVPIIKYVIKENEIVDLTKWTIVSFISIFFFLLSIIILLLSISSIFFVNSPTQYNTFIIGTSLLVGGEYYITIFITQIIALIFAIYSFVIGVIKPKQDICSVLLSGIDGTIVFLAPILLVVLSYLNYWFGYFI